MLRLFFFFFCLFLFSCDDDPVSPVIYGCMDSQSCNYDSNSTHDNDSCLYLDECGECGGAGIAEGACDCDGNVEDCAGDCGGSAEEDCAGDCGGSAEEDDCGVCDECDIDINSIYLTAEQELWYHIDEDIYGFQFDIYGITITDITNGDAQASEFEIEYVNGSNFSRVLGYSPTSSKITLDCGNLIGISYDGNMQEISNIIFGTAYGEQIQVSYQACE